MPIDRVMSHLLHLLSEGTPFRFALAICAARFDTTEGCIERAFYRS